MSGVVGIHARGYVAELHVHFVDLLKLVHGLRQFARLFQHAAEGVEQLLALVVEGGTNKDIGSQLGISEETVKRHLTNIFDKAGVSSRLELAMFALNHGLSRQ